MRVFVSGPYTAGHPRDVLKNVNRAIEVGIVLMKAGHDVFIPHLSHYIHLHPDCPFEYEEYRRNDLAWLEVSDAIVVIADSPGVRGELRFARDRGIPEFAISDLTQKGR